MANVVGFTTPLMRQTVGFDRFNDLFESLLNDTSDNFDNYPPYNIEKLNDDKYRIVMAVAGFNKDDIEIMMQGGQLRVAGRMQDKPEDKDGVEILHRGIGTRSFERTFRLADYIHVTGADMQDGLLIIDLIREIPEEKKPRMIPINGGKSKLLGKK
jgi:molecular chaperone IbpA